MSQEATSSVERDTRQAKAGAGGAAGGGKSFLGAAKLISFFTLISRILGMARESVSANYFGAGIVSSAFTVAFSIPNMFRKLFGEGALSAAFIPLYAQAVRREQQAGGDGSDLPQSAGDFAAASVNLLCLILLVITAVGELILWGMMALDPNMRLDRMLTLRFTAIMLPYLVLICGTAFLSSILQVHKRFAAPAAAPIVLNICHIVVIILGAKFLGLRSHGPTDAPDTITRQTMLANWLSMFVLVAGALQVLMLVPSLRAVGFGFKWVRRFWTPAVKKMLRLSVPVALGAGVLQLSVLMDKGISLLLAQGRDASGHLITTFHFMGTVVNYPMAEGAAARLNWAQFLYQFPLGVFAIALATAIFPDLSADAFAKDRERFRSVLRLGIEATLFEGLAASVGLIIVRDPAVRLLFQHGHIAAGDSELIARSVLFYSMGIWSFSLLQIISRGFYALHDAKTPLLMAVLNIVINLVVELPLVWMPSLGEAGMAVGTCVSFAAQTVVMLAILNRRIGGLHLRTLVPTVLKMSVAAAAMWIACRGVQWLPFYPHGQTKLVWAGQLAILMSVGAGTYLMICAASGIGVMAHLRPKRLLRKGTGK